MKTAFVLLFILSFIQITAQTNSLINPEFAPEEVVKGENLFWGNNYDGIFLSKDKGKTWENFFENGQTPLIGEYYFSHIHLLNDSSVVIWDAPNKKNYLYSLHERNPQLYFYTSPLEDFLKHPITQVYINSANSGCFHYYGDEIEYSLGENLIFETIRLESRGKDKIVHKKNQVLKQEKYFDKDFKLNLTHAQVYDALKEMNQTYSSIPRLSDFKITKSDKENYLELIQKLAEERKQIGRAKPLDKEFYNAVAGKIDTLPDTITQAVFKKPVPSLSTSDIGFFLLLTNSANDTLMIFNKCDDGSNPHGWYLGWEVYYKDKRFIVNNLNFSKAVKSWLPSDFAFSEYFDNSYVIMSIADYLYKKEHPQE
jgi:hypothetical protein